MLNNTSFLRTAAALSLLISPVLINVDSAQAAIEKYPQVVKRGENLIKKHETQRYLSKSKDSIVVFNVPDLSPEAMMVERTDPSGEKVRLLRVSIPASIAEGPINDVLRANEGRFKDTNFQKIDVSNMRVSFGDQGFYINGNWQFQAREKIVSFFGKTHYTPWVSVSGTFNQKFNVSVEDGILKARAGKTSVRSAGKWYQSILDSLITAFTVEGNVNKNINKQLENINGMGCVSLSRKKN
jgi:hypothetical protein